MAPRSNGAAAQEPVVREGGVRPGRDTWRTAGAGGGPGGWGAAGGVVSARRRGGPRRRPQPSSPLHRHPLGERRAQATAQERVRARLGRGSPGTAGPSPRGRWGHASSTRSRTTGSRRSGGRPSGLARLQARAHVAGGDMPSNATGSTSSARISIPSITRGPGRTKAPPSTTNTRSSRTARRSAQPSGRGVDSQARVASGSGSPSGSSTSTSGSISRTAVPRGRFGGAAVLAEQLPATGEAHLVGDPAADGPRRIDGAQQHDPWRLEPAIAAPHHDLLQRPGAARAGPPRRRARRSRPRSSRRPPRCR